MGELAQKTYDDLVRPILRQTGLAMSTLPEAVKIFGKACTSALHDRLIAIPAARRAKQLPKAIAAPLVRALPDVSDEPTLQKRYIELLGKLADLEHRS